MMNPKRTMMWKTFLTKYMALLAVLGLVIFYPTINFESNGGLCGERTLQSISTGQIRREWRVAFFVVKSRTGETWLSREIRARGSAKGEGGWSVVRIKMPLVRMCYLSQASRINWQINNTGRFLSWAKPNDEVFLDLKNQFVDAFLKQDLEEMRLVSDKLAERAIATDPEGD